MKIRLIVATCAGADTPWVVGAWDELTMDACPQEYADDVAKASANNECVRLLDVKIPDAALEDAFKPHRVMGQLIPHSDADGATQ